MKPGFGNIASAVGHKAGSGLSRIGDWFMTTVLAWVVLLEGALAILAKWLVVSHLHGLAWYYQWLICIAIGLCITIPVGVVLKFIDKSYATRPELLSNDWRLQVIPEDSNVALSEWQRVCWILLDAKGNRPREDEVIMIRREHKFALFPLIAKTALAEIVVAGGLVLAALYLPYHIPWWLIPAVALFTVVFAGINFYFQSLSWRYELLVATNVNYWVVEIWPAIFFWKDVIKRNYAYSLFKVANHSPQGAIGNTVGYGCVVISSFLEKEEEKDFSNKRFIPDSDDFARVVDDRIPYTPANAAHKATKREAAAKLAAGKSAEDLAETQQQPVIKADMA